jgi:hypothetical protein
VNHYHVRRHSDDDDPYVSDDLFACLDYAATELDQLADFEHDYVSTVAAKVEEDWSRVSGLVTPHEAREALLSFAKCERYVALMANARNIVKQHNTPRRDRAPLYTEGWLDQGAKEADARLLLAANHTAQEINDGSPISIGGCTAEMRTWPDEDQMHGGETYCSDEYPDGYAGYQDGPCGDY